MNLLNISLVIVSMAGLLLLVFSFKKKSQSPILLGGIAFIAPIFYFLGWISFLPIVPVIALAISYIGKKNVHYT
ncbi:hypothetical protein ACFSMW_16125 [Virgibacillus halophilus]|uniref:hypothetical protein n=1 Tax=Tigheibacillus halophilus TaxID=361280 RepID=UPI00362E5584